MLKLILFRLKKGLFGAAALLGVAVIFYATAGNILAAAQADKNTAAEIVVYTSELPKKALYEFKIWDDPAAAGGKMIGYPNTGDELDPPPENDPHVTFQVTVEKGLPYRAWVHMKVGAPKGKSTANVVWLQFSDAVDMNKTTILKPGSPSYLTATGPLKEGWAWVKAEMAGKPAEAGLVSFQKAGEITVRIQGGMEGVGFDQFVLSPAMFLEQAPMDAVVKK